MEVDIDRPSCSSCAQAHGCGLGNGAGPARSAPIRLHLMANAEEGKAVSLQVPDKQLLHGVLLAYVVPLLLGLAGAIVAQALVGMLGGEQMNREPLLAAPAGFACGLALGIANLWRSGRKGVFGQVHHCIDISADEPH